MIVHRFESLPSGIKVPCRLNNPFGYKPHPLSMIAADATRQYIATQQSWHEELSHGKMFGVLVVRDGDGQLGYLAAYSGLLAGRNDWPYFVPPVYDFQQPDGYFKREEAQISAINRQVGEITGSWRLLSARKLLQAIESERDDAIEAYRSQMEHAKRQRDLIRDEIGRGLRPKDDEAPLIAQSQYMKAELRRLKKSFASRLDEARATVSQYEQEIRDMQQERHKRSEALQRWLFDRFVVSNALGQSMSLTKLFKSTALRLPPAGAGECCAPKLLQAAYANGLSPVSIAEFWWGDSPAGEIRHDGHYYPACRGKCLPILSFMLRGIDVEPAPSPEDKGSLEPRIVYQDDGIVVVDKPAGLLSVPGKETTHSVESWLRSTLPHAQGPLIVHRLDAHTSGLMVAALTKEAHKHLQAQFAEHSIEKEYIALLDGRLDDTVPAQGIIDLPLATDLNDRPRQKADHKSGKRAVTRYEVLSNGAHCRVLLRPDTGRTHQLRVHCAHNEGLGTPILGDPLYGKPGERLHLHASRLVITHPVTGQRIAFDSEPDF